MMLLGLIGFWCAFGMYYVALASSYIGLGMTRFLASVAINVIAPTACVAMITAGALLVIDRDFKRPLLFAACLVSLALLGFWVMFGHTADLPFERSGFHLTYGLIKAFYSTSGLLGPPTLVAIRVSLLGPQTLVALLPLAELYPRFFHPSGVPPL
jgi:hypothetical protein